MKGELLLKKHNGEEGGDDIDFDRRLLSSSDEYTFRKVYISFLSFHGYFLYSKTTFEDYFK